MTETELLNIIDRFEKLLDDFDSSNSDSRELWRLKKEILDGFKEVRFAERQDRQNAWEKFISFADSLKEKQNSINNENEKFAEGVNRKLDDVAGSIEGSFFSKDLDKESFADQKRKLNDIFELVKQHRFPSKESKNSAWEKFNSLRDKLKEKEDKFYGNIREKRTKRIDHSGELTNKILSTIDACDPNTSIDALLDLLGTLALYATGIGFIIHFFQMITGTKDSKPENPLKIKSQSLKDIRKFINDNKDDITREDKQKIFSRLDSVSTDLNRAWDDYKEQRETKKHEWERNQREFLGKLETRLSNQIAFKNKLEGIQDNQQNFLDKLEKRLASQQDYLKKQEDRLDDIEDKYDWIDKAKAKISEIEDDIDKLKDKIRDVERDIEELPQKIRNLEKDIEELEKKIEEVRSKLDR